jgi:hypothetical protein
MLRKVKHPCIPTIAVAIPEVPPSDELLPEAYYQAANTMRRRVAESMDQEEGCGSLR